MVTHVMPLATTPIPFSGTRIAEKQICGMINSGNVETAATPEEKIADTISDSENPARPVSTLMASRIGNWNS